MTIQLESQQAGNLLSEQERIAFKMISTGNDLHGKRAVALLAFDAGATQAEAARQAGLSPGQVKYWLGKFRQVRMQIFPEELRNAEQVAQASEEKARAGKPKIIKSQKSKPKKAKKGKSKKSGKKKGKNKKKKGKNNKKKNKSKKKSS
jgi:transposase-like protein